MIFCASFAFYGTETRFGGCVRSSIKHTSQSDYIYLSLFAFLLCNASVLVINLTTY